MGRGVEAISKVIEKNVQNFVYNNILMRFGVPHAFIMDNRRQFNCKGMKKFYKKYRIEAHYTSVAPTQANGQVEVINKIVMDSLKARVERYEGK